MVYDVAMDTVTSEAGRGQQGGAHSFMAESVWLINDFKILKNRLDHRVTPVTMILKLLKHICFCWQDM